jgi:hypothetical protein
MRRHCLLLHAGHGHLSCAESALQTGCAQSVVPAPCSHLLDDCQRPHTSTDCSLRGGCVPPILHQLLLTYGDGCATPDTSLQPPHLPAEAQLHPAGCATASMVAYPADALLMLLSMLQPGYQLLLGTSTVTCEHLCVRHNRCCRGAAGAPAPCCRQGQKQRIPALSPGTHSQVKALHGCGHWCIHCMLVCNISGLGWKHT